MWPREVEPWLVHNINTLLLITIFNDDTFPFFFFKRAGLGDFCHEVDLLKKLIQDAALATSVSGRLLSTGKRAALRARRAARSMSVPSRGMCEVHAYKLTT